MYREILTYPISAVQIRGELAFFVQHFQSLKYEFCDVLFGAAWGNDYYPTAEWKIVRLPLAGLIEEVSRVETANLGKLGSDDLFVQLPNLDLEFRFCNDCDIHIEFQEPSEITEFFYQRWKRLGFTPADYSRIE
ncbi:MAG: hypothetical protein ABH826_01175, partial [Patescibacteria group bacterium]